VEENGVFHSRKLHVGRLHMKKKTLIKRAKITQLKKKANKNSLGIQQYIISSTEINNKL